MMRRWTRMVLRELRMLVACGLGVLGATAAPSAGAHDVPPSLLMIDIGQSSIVADLELPLTELGKAMSLPLAATPSAVLGAHREAVQRYVESRFSLHAPDGRTYRVGERSYSLKTTDNRHSTGNEWLVVRTRFDAPAGARTDVFTVDDTAIIHSVVTHEALVYVRRDVRNGLLGDSPALVSTAGYGHTHIDIDASAGSWFQGFRRLFALGMHHIAEGTDHLLFLLALLLPAPLVARAGRWAERKPVGASVRAIVSVVTGFTVGHSLSLGLAASGWIQAPSRPVETLIAVSILVSCAHAVRPFFAGRETWIAAGFGLVHGLAFAEVLSGLNFDATTLATSLVGFNLGIEAMQLLVIAVTLPLLLLVSRTAWYGRLRLACSGVVAVCALGWLVERAVGIENPVQRVVNSVALSNAAWLAVLAFVATVAVAMRWGKTVFAVRSKGMASRSSAK